MQILMFQEFFDKKIVTKNLKRQVGVVIFERGMAYLQDNSVGMVTVTPLKGGNIRIEAFVLGNDEYQTEIIFNLKECSFEDIECSCPYNGGDCKHGVALGLKFIKLYDDFCQNSNSGSDIVDYKKELAWWIKNAKQNKAEDWEDTVYDSQESDGEYLDDDLTMEDAGTKNTQMSSRDDVKIDSKSEGDASMSLKERLKSVGIDSEKVPEFAFKKLEKKFNDNEIKFGTQIKSGEDVAMEKFGERLPRRYCLVLLTDYYPRIELHEKNKPDVSYWAAKPDELLSREKNHLTQNQKALLMYLGQITSQYYDTGINWGKLFNLARESGISIFLNRKVEKNRIAFGENKQKLMVQMCFRQNTEYSENKSGEKITDIVFKLKNDLFSNRNVKIFSSDDALAVLIGLKLEIFPIPMVASGLILRILQRVSDYYTYESYYKQNGRPKPEMAENLNDEEIIQINEIIAASQQMFDFENNLPGQFEITKFKKTNPVILVDYDNAGSSLQLHATIDYGYAKVDVASSVYRSIRRGRLNFQKRYFNGRDKYHLEITENKINYTEIDDRAEIALFKKFSNDEGYGFSKTLKCVKKGVKQIANFQENCWPKIKALGFTIQYIHDEFDFVEENFKADFKVDFNEANDWFEFDVSCYCGSSKITLEDLRRFVENKEQFIKMADGKMMKITNRAELEKFVLMLESFYQKENQKFEAKIYHAPELEDMISGSAYYESKISKSFRKFMDEAQSGKPVEKIKIPEKITKPLRDYQKEGIDWFYFLRKYHFGGILADDMGLGKTLQALSLIEMNKIENKPSLVICPKTLLFNWEDEAAKFFPKMKTLVIDGMPPERRQKLSEVDKYDLVIASYPSVKKDQLHYNQLKFNYCLIDEAQYIKNHKTLSARSVKKIHADFRLALTGTPLENSVSEIWSFFDFLMPGFLGTHGVFAERYEKPIMKNADGDALKSLKKKIACFMLRRTKEKVLRELPPKIEQVSHCQLGSEQNILYQEILANVKSNIFETVEAKGFAKSQIHILAGLTKLRQVCNHPVLLLKDKDHEKYASAKLELFLELVNEIVAGGKKVLVFSQFTQMLDILGKELDKQEIAFHYLSGKTQNRKELVQDFNSNAKIPVFLISLKAGGTGLNLVSADSVIIFDPWWNPSVENQAIDRAHRIGQKKSVNVYRLIVKGTIEEKIVQLQEKKKFLFDNMVGESNDLFKKLTWSDVKELFD